MSKTNAQLTLTSSTGKTLREILIELSAATGEEYHKLHNGQQGFTITNGRMTYYENQAQAQIIELIEGLIGEDEILHGNAYDPTIFAVSEARNKLRADIRSRLETLGDSKESK